MRMRKAEIGGFVALCGLCVALVLFSSTSARQTEPTVSPYVDVLQNQGQKSLPTVGRYQGAMDSDNCPWLFDTVTGACWQANLGEFAKPLEGVEWRKVARPLSPSN